MVKRLIEQESCEHGKWGPHQLDYFCPGSSSREVTVDYEAAIESLVGHLPEAIQPYADRIAREAVDVALADTEIPDAASRAYDEERDRRATERWTKGTLPTIVDAARRQAHLTSPETIEKAANELFKWDEINDEIKSWHYETAEAVLRSVEEGET